MCAGASHSAHFRSQPAFRKFSVSFCWGWYSEYQSPKERSPGGKLPS